MASATIMASATMASNRNRFPTLPVLSPKAPQTVWDAPGMQRLTETFVREREPEESFQACVQRIGKAKLRRLLEDLTKVPDSLHDRSYYSDWGDTREYTLGDMGVGECAGEVVSLTEFGLAASERQVFEAQLQLDTGETDTALQTGYHSMLLAAKALIQTRNIDVPDEPARIVEEFRELFYDTELFFDPFAGPKFVHALLQAYEEGAVDVSAAAYFAGDVSRR